MSRLLDELKKVAESAKGSGHLGEYRQGQITVPSQVILALLEDRKALLETLTEIAKDEYPHTADHVAQEAILASEARIAKLGDEE